MWFADSVIAIANTLKGISTDSCTADAFAEVVDHLEASGAPSHSADSAGAT